MSGSSPFPVKLRKTKVEQEKKSAGKFEVKLKKVAKPEEEKKDGVGFGVSLKKVNQKKEGKEGGIELPKLKKINKGGKEDNNNEKPGFKLKKISRGKNDGEEDNNDNDNNPFAVKLKKANKKGGDGDADADNAGSGGVDMPKLKTASKLLEKGMAELEEQMKKIALRKTSEGKLSDGDLNFHQLKPLTPAERAAKQEAKKTKFASMTEAEKAEYIEKKRARKLARKQRKKGSAGGTEEVSLKKTSRSEREAEEKRKLDVNLKRVDRKQREDEEKNKIDRNLKRVERNYNDEEEDDRERANLKRVERGDKEFVLSERTKVELKKGKNRKEKEISARQPRGEMLTGGDGSGDEDEDSQEEFSDSDFDSDEDFYDFAPRAANAPIARLKSGKEVHVSWTSKFALDDDVIGYDIERRTNQNGDWVKINESPVETTRYTDSKVEEGAVYDYRVIARNGKKASVASQPSAPVRVKRQKPPRSEQMNKVPTSPGFDIGDDFYLSEEAPNALPLLSKENRQCVMRVRRGDPCPFTLPLTGYPAPKICWTKNGGDVPSHIEFHDSETEAGFFIGVCELKDGATYTCSVENEKGNNEYSVKIIVCDAPAPPEGPLKVTNIKEESVSLKWKPPKDDGGAKLDGYIVEKSTAKDPNTWIPVGVTEECEIDAANLKKNEDYSFRVSAENEVGKSDFLELDESVQVKKEAASSPQDVSASSESSTSALVSWASPLDAGATPIAEFVVEKRDVGEAKEGGGRRTEIEAQVLRDRLQDDKEVGWAEAARVGGQENRAIVEDLEADRKYQFRVIPEHPNRARGCKSVPSLPFDLKADAGRGNRGKSGDQNIGPILTLPGRPECVLASKVTRDGVVLTWEAPPCDGGSAIKGYIVEKRESGGYWSTVNSKPHSQRTMEVDDIRPGEAVRFRVRAVNAVGTGDESKPTDTILPPELSRTDLNPGKPDVLSDSTTSVSLQWKHPLAVEDFLGYNVEVKMPNGQWVRANEDLITTNSFIATNLRENQGYEFRVCVLDRNGGNTGVSRPAEAKTRAETKDDPSKIALFDATTMSATASLAHVKWSLSSKQNENYDSKIRVVAYMLEVKENDGPWERLPTSVTSTDATIPDLIRGFVYQFRVLGVISGNLVGLPGAPSDAVLASDPPSAPVVSASLAPIVVVVGQSLRIAAPFQASPKPDVAWNKGDTSLAGADRMASKTSDNMAELFIPSCKRKDAGCYRVKLSNLVGVAECSCQVTVLGPPSAPNGPLTALEVREESIVLQWAAPDDDGGSHITGYRLETRKCGKKCWRLVESCWGSTTKAVVGLSAATDYEFRVFAANAVGQSPPLHSEQSFSTRPKLNDDSSDDALRTTADRLPGPPEKPEEETRPCFTFGLRPRAIQKSNSVRLICCLQGNPMPKVTWSKDGKEIDQLDPQFSTEVNAGVCSLDVALCKRENAGVYTCAAKNKLGQDKTSCKLVVEEIRYRPLNQSHQ